MQVDHLGVEWAVHHLSALAGVKAKPSSGGDIRALFQADRRFNAEACAVAQAKFGASLRNRQGGDWRGNHRDETANHLAMLIGIGKAGNRRRVVRPYASRRTFLAQTCLLDSR
jgi:hypothetical protein